MLAAPSILPIIGFLCRFFWSVCASRLVFWRGFVDKLAIFYLIQFIFSNPLPGLKTGLIPTNTRWCGTQRHLRLRIGITMTKVQRSWKPTGTPCARRKCLLCHCHGAHPERVLTVAGRYWGATPSASSVERSVLPWMRRSMTSKKPLFSLHNMWSGPFAMTVVFCSCYTLPIMPHTFVSLGELCWWKFCEQFMTSVPWQNNAIFSLLLISVSAVALIFTPSWWACWAVLFKWLKEACNGISSIYHEVISKPSSRLLHNLPLPAPPPVSQNCKALIAKNDWSFDLWFYTEQEKNPQTLVYPTNLVTDLGNEGSCWHCDDWKEL